MKAINNYIVEKLKVNKNKFKDGSECTLFPETKSKLIQMVKDEIYKNGNECSLNHIDVSKIKDMSWIFGKHDYLAFGLEEFNGDISSWKVGNKPVDMSYMFSDSLFKQNISNWKLKDSCIVNNMFKGCDIKEEYKPFINDKRVS